MLRWKLFLFFRKRKVISVLVLRSIHHHHHSLFLRAMLNGCVVKHYLIHLLATQIRTWDTLFLLKNLRLFIEIEIISVRFLNIFASRCKFNGLSVKLAFNEFHELWQRLLTYSIINLLSLYANVLIRFILCSKWNCFFHSLFRSFESILVLFHFLEIFSVWEICIANSS